MSISTQRKNVLILGGGEGLAVRELLKYRDVERITVVDIDPEITELAKHNPVITKINQNSMIDIRLQVLNQDALKFVENSEDFFDVIIVDLPDPSSIHLARLYSREFYTLCLHRLAKYGILVTQASSPVHSVNSFLCVINTMESAGFTVLPYHNNVPTLGEWGWCLGMKRETTTFDELKSKVMEIDLKNIPTLFLNNEAIISMIHFGKGIWTKREK